MMRLQLALFFLFSIYTPDSYGAQESDPLPTLKLDRVPALPAFAGQTRAPAAKASSYSVETIASGLTMPWALAFLPDQSILINE